MTTAYQAIETKHLPATNTRGSRIKATCERGSLTVGYPHELSGADCHIYAADQLCEKFIAEDVKKYGSTREQNPWGKPRICGGLKNSYVHVFTA